MSSEQDSRPIIVGLGEALLRLTSHGKTPIGRAHRFDAEVGGTELGLLVAASALGARGRWLTRVPENDHGERMCRHARSFGLDVRAIVEPESRAGLFFLEFGAPPRPSTVLYDRRDSAASHLSPDDFSWPDVLSDANVAHSSGITCALGEGPLETVLAFFRAARAAHVATSFDLNYRAQLWSLDDALAAFRRVLPLVDLAFVGPRDLEALYGEGGESFTLAQRFREEFGVATVVVRERREVAVDEISVTVRVVNDDVVEASARAQVVDEIGAGDVAAGAFLASALTGASNVLAAERSARAYARMLTIPGDSWSGTVHDLTDGYVTSRRVLR